MVTRPWQCRPAPAAADSREVEDMLAIVRRWVAEAAYKARHTSGVVHVSGHPGALSMGTKLVGEAGLADGEQGYVTSW
jgi:hypothetical protein